MAQKAQLQLHQHWQRLAASAPPLNFAHSCMMRAVYMCHNVVKNR